MRLYYFLFLLKWRAEAKCADACRGNCDDAQCAEAEAEGLCDDCEDEHYSKRRLQGGCSNACLGLAGGCDALVPLGATCADLETNEFLQLASATCDCSGCTQCGETDDFPPSTDACGGNEGAVEVRSETDLSNALNAGAACTALALLSDVTLTAAAEMSTSVRLSGSSAELSASGPHRLVTVLDQAVVSMTTLKLRGGFDPFAGGCVFVAGGSSLSLENVLFEDCAAGTFGGGIAVWSKASLIMMESSFTGNVAGFYGGAVYGHSSSRVSATECSITGSTGAAGGGVAVTQDASLTMASVSIADCSSTLSGGAVAAGRGATATLSGVITTSHSDGSGGGVYGFAGSSLVVHDLAVGNCSAADGGGLKTHSGAFLTISDSTFVRCVARTATGGGAAVQNVGASFENVRLINCSSTLGGGGGLALAAASSATLADCFFEGCHAGTSGGAVAAILPGVVLALVRTTITACLASLDGGGLYLGQNCHALVESSSLSGNFAGAEGGAVAVGAASKVAVTATLLEKNIAASRGGGLSLLASGAAAGVSDCVFTGNVAVGGGGGATVGGGAVLHLGPKSTFMGNTAGVDGGAIEVRGAGAQLYASGTCAFVQLSLDWTAARTTPAAEASLFLGGQTGRDSRGSPSRFTPLAGALAHFEACLPPGSSNELWAASSAGAGWLQGAFSLTLPPHPVSVLNDGRVSFLQAVNEFHVLGLSAADAHGARATSFSLDAFSPGASAGKPDSVSFTDNVAVQGDGGGVSLNDFGRMVAYGAVLENNVARLGHGGGIVVNAQATAILQFVRGDSNSAAGDGGAVRVGTLGVLDVSNSTFQRNRATVRGGFAALDRIKAITFRNVRAVANRAKQRGGAVALILCNEAPIFTIFNSTFDGNSAFFGSGSIDIGARSIVSSCGVPPFAVLRVSGSTTFIRNSVDQGSGGGVAVRPTGASLAFEAQPLSCVGVLRVVTDWRSNSVECLNGPTEGPLVEATCDASPGTCDSLRSLSTGRCDGCACKAAVLGGGESYFTVTNGRRRGRNPSLGPRAPGSPLYVGEPDAGAAKAFEFCLESGDYVVQAFDSRGAKWFGGSLQATVSTFDGLSPFFTASAEWSTGGLETAPLRFTVGSVSARDLAVKFRDNEALQGGGAGVFFSGIEPEGLLSAQAFSQGNKAAYGDFAATLATALLINTTLTSLKAVPNAAMPFLTTALVDQYGQVVKSDSSTVVSARFEDDSVQASGLVAICEKGVATFDTITLTGVPGDSHSLGFFAPASSLQTAALNVELTTCPVGFTEREDSEIAVSCIPCEYTEYYSNGGCVPCPRGAACGRYPPLDASSATVGYQLFTASTLPIEVGYYRFFAESEALYECADKDYCADADCSCAGVGYQEAFEDSSETFGISLCAPHSSGPLCALCEEGYYPRPSSLGQGGGCAQCDGKSVLPIFFAIVLGAFVVGLAAVSIFALACAGGAKTKKRVLQATSFAKSRWFIVAAVQVWYAVSTVSRFVAIENVDYPEPLSTVLQFFGFMSFDLSFVVPSMQCYYTMNYFELFLAWTMFPFAFGVLLSFGVVLSAVIRVGAAPYPSRVWRQVTRTDVGRATRRTATSLFWLVVVLLHNYICSIIFTFYSCSERFATSPKSHEQWLTYDYEVRCGSDNYRYFRSAATFLLILYVVLVPASLLLKLKLNRFYGRPDGALSFFTRHVRPAVWYYEILALEMRIVICGALVPLTQRGLRLSILLVVIFAWMTLTREMRPYINRGHTALVNFLQIFVLAAIALALVLFAELLSEGAAKVFAGVVSCISVAITLRLYSAFKNEEVTGVLELIKLKRAFDRPAFDRLRLGMNVRVMDDAVFATALSILDDELRATPSKASRGFEAAELGWKYLTTQLLPLSGVWTHLVQTRTILATHEVRLLNDAALLARTRMRSKQTPVFVSGDQFAKDVDIVLGPLAQELHGDVVAVAFTELASSATPPMLDFMHFQKAVRTIVDALIQEHAGDDFDESATGRGSFKTGLKPVETPLRASEAPFKAISLQDKAAPLRDAALAAESAFGREIGKGPSVGRGLSFRAKRSDCFKLAALKDEGALERGGDDDASDEAVLDEAAGCLTVGPMEDQSAWARRFKGLLGKATKVSPQGSSEHFPANGRRFQEAFFDLAIHAHAANFKCLIVMEEAAAAILAEPDWGQRICALADFDSGESLQAPLRDPLLTAWTNRLGGDSLKEHFDEAVLPHALRSVALDAHPAFISALKKLLCTEDAAEDAEEKASDATWTSKCSLYKSEVTTAVKSAARMTAKVGGYRKLVDPLKYSVEASAEKWPYAAQISDPLRATVVCDDAEAIVRAYEALVGDCAGENPFTVTRLKNKLALCTKPFNLHVNCAFHRGGGLAPITVEVQIVPRVVNVVMGPSHKFYTLSRAPHAGALAE